MSIQNRLAEILESDLAYDEYPPSAFIIEALGYTTRHRQPLQVFYHAIRAYVRNFIRDAPAEIRDPRDSQIVGQFLSYYFYYTRGDPGPDPLRRAANDLWTGLHNYEYHEAAGTMFNEGYRAVTTGSGWRRRIDILPPGNPNPYYILPESAAAA